jgi:NitT/TauT family transport system substrate-binding protein
MLQIRRLRLVLLITMLLLLTGCQALTLPAQLPTATQSGAESVVEVQDQQVEIPDLGPIKIGYIPIVQHAPLMVAQEKGYFAAQGLEVELIFFRSLPEMVPLLATGELDLGLGDHSANLLNAVASEMPIKVVGGVLEYPEGWEDTYAVRKDLFDSGEVAELSDLSGRKIAIQAVGGFGEFTLSQLLAQAGISIDDVELVVLGPTDMSLAMANGAVDAATLWGPLAKQSFADGVSAPLAYEFETATHITSFVVGKRLLDSGNQEITIRILTALYTAIQQDLAGADYPKDEEISLILQKYTDLPLAMINNNRPDPFIYDGKVDAESINRIQNYFFDRGYLNYSELLSIDEIVDESFLNEALRRLNQSEE